MEERDPMSLSGNDIMPEPEEPIPGETGIPPTEEGQDPVTDPGTPPQEEGQEPGGDTAPPQQQPPAQETGSAEGSISKEDLQELLDGISAGFEQKDADTADLTESIRSLVDMMSVDLYSTPGYVYEPPEIPIEGYREWEYPVTVDYLVTVVGYGDPMPQSNDYDDPDQFLEDFQGFAFECYKGNVFSEFYIDRVWGADGKKLYDSQGMEEPEPDPGEEEPDETVELLLSHLEGINTALSEMRQADLEYCQSVAAYQEEMMQLQTADTGATLILCIAVFAVLGELAIKHLLEVFR